MAKKPLTEDTEMVDTAKSMMTAKPVPPWMAKGKPKAKTAAKKKKKKTFFGKI